MGQVTRLGSVNPTQNVGKERNKSVRVPLWWRACEPFVLAGIFCLLCVVYVASRGTMWEEEDENTDE